MADYITMFHSKLLDTPPHLLKKWEEMFLRTNGMLSKAYLIKWGLLWFKGKTIMEYCEKCKEKHDLKETAFKVFNRTCNICGRKTVTIYYSKWLKGIKGYEIF